MPHFETGTGRAPEPDSAAKQNGLGVSSAAVAFPHSPFRLPSATGGRPAIGRTATTLPRARSGWLSATVTPSRFAFVG